MQPISINLSPNTSATIQLISNPYESGKKRKLYVDIKTPTPNPKKPRHN
jgi:hypothetical protein